MNGCSRTIIIHLKVEAAATYELTHNRGGRYLLVADGQEESEELQQSVSL